MPSASPSFLLLLVWLAVAIWLALMCRRVMPILVARFDRDVLQAPPTLSSTDREVFSARDSQVLAELVRWCQADLDRAASPFLMPWRRIPPAHPCRRILWSGAEPAVRARVANALCLQLDGSDTLMRLSGTAARWHYRARVKMRDVCWWRPPAPTDPWDSGYLRQSASALAGLNQFAPRRATLIVIDGLPSSSLADCLARLEARQHHFEHPVRLLVLADSPYQDIRFDKALSGG